MASTTIYAKEVAISFDDGPTGDGRVYTALERTKLLIESLEQAEVDQAIFFVNGSKFTETGKEQLKLYASAGHLIGNHTFNHSSLREVAMDEYLTDIRKGHEAVKDLAGFVNLFRYPHLREGDTIAERDRIRAELHALGYKNGYVTIDNYDFYMNSLVARQLKAGKKVDFKKLKQVYVGVLVDAAEYYYQLAVDALGRSPQHVLLLHENDLAAMFLSDLIMALRSKGWSIVTVESAYNDPIADNIPDTLYNDQGRVAALAHLKSGEEPRSVGESAEYLEKLFEAKGVYK